jgi:hypothetical protein
MFSEIVINKYFLLATHFITKLPKNYHFLQNQVLHIADINVPEFFLLIFLFVGRMRMGKTCQRS